MKNITMRTLSQNDLVSVVDIHLNTFSDRALAGMGRETVRRYYEWQLLGPHDAIAIGIFQGECLTGFCFAGVFRGALSGFLKNNMWFLAWHILIHPWLISKPFIRERIGLAWNILLRRSVPAVLPSVIPRKSFGILAIAVDPKFQGAGLGKRLMTEIEKVAVEQSFSWLHLTVDVNNSQAIVFYRNLGWQKLLASDGLWHGSMIKSLMGSHE